VKTDLDLAPEELPWECVLESKPTIGEVPVWAGAENSMYWIDVYNGLLNRTNVDNGRTDTWDVHETIGCYGLIEGEAAALVALQSGIYRLDFGTGNLEKRIDPPYDPERFRFNDGRADARGRFWVGNMPLKSLSGPRPDKVSNFWYVENGELNFGVDKMTIANGIAFNADSTVLYLADDPSQSVLAFDYDLDTAKATNRRAFCTVPGGVTLDGAAVDTENNYWIALPRQETIAKFRPDGSLDRIIKSPTRRPAMVCFGGQDLGQLYVVTMTNNYPSKEELAADPLAGGMFRVNVGATGLPEPKVVL
jgi:sugar lactone lactonase YvrE